MSIIVFRSPPNISLIVVIDLPSSSPSSSSQKRTTPCPLSPMTPTAAAIIGFFAVSTTVVSSLSETTLGRVEEEVVMELLLI